MQDSNFDNLETTFGKSSVTQERISLVASHMYKQYLDSNNARFNGLQCFMEIYKEVQIIADLLKQTFAARNIPTQDICVYTDRDKNYITLNILWQKITFSTKYNKTAQYLERDMGNSKMLSFRIMAINGGFDELMKNSDEEEMEIMLTNEVASLYIPAEKNQIAIMTVKSLLNKEFSLSPVDASKEFVLKVIELVCGGGIVHQKKPKKTQLII